MHENLHLYSGSMSVNSSATVRQFISDTFPYVGNQSMLWDHFALLGLLEANPTEYIDCIKLAVGKYHCECDLQMQYRLGACSSDRDRLISLVDLNQGVTFKGICPVHPGRNKHVCYCDKHKPNNQCQPSTSSKGARRREQRKRAKARKMINESNLIINELNC